VAVPTVSVILPTYNRKSLLLEALQSVFAQTYRDYEVIVVDDGSTDQTREALEPLFHAIRYISKPNGGEASARNRGIQEAQGGYVAFLDSDDLWEPRFLEVTTDYLGRHPDLGLVSTAWWTIPKGRREPRVRKPVLHGDLFPLLMRQSFISASAVVARRECFQRVGVFNESLEQAADYDMWLRIARAYPIAFLNTPLGRRRKHPGNISRNRLLLRKRALQIAEAHYDPARVSDAVYQRLRSELYISMGRAHLKLGEVEEAKTCFRQAAALTPYRPRPRRYLWMTILFGRWWGRPMWSEDHRA
jgi:glycosyltransferase involved in cell wall biosynthesis